MINLYEIWWMVVLIASVSFIGYFSVRIAGPEKGLLFTGFFGGLSSSTATTLHFSRPGAQCTTKFRVTGGGNFIGLWHHVSARVAVRVFN